MKRIDVAFITDEGFALLTGVAIYSLKKNSNKKFVYNINIICSGVSSESKSNFKKLASKGFNINIIELDGSKYRSMKKDNLHVSTTALFKFDLPNIFFKLDKILYIDGDVLIQDDLVDLFNTNIDGKYAGVVVDYNGLTYPSDFRKRLKIKHKFYFNSGMMLLNLSKMRKDNITKKLLDYRKKGVNFYMDQDALNVVFKENVKYLSLNYNFVVTCWRHADHNIFTDFFHLNKQKNMMDYLNNASIVHYASADKPSKYYDVPHASRWYQYFQNSTFKQTTLNRQYLKKKVPDHIYFKREDLQDQDVVKTDTPSISVIVPSYNSERYIKSTLQTIVSQSLKNIEIICVDDGSTDSTCKIIESFMKNDSRIKLIKQKNQHAGVARNNGIGVATGDYVVFCDSDDKLRDEALMKLYKKAINTDADIVLAKAFSLDDITKKVSIEGAGFCLNNTLLPNKDVFNAEDIPTKILNITGGNPWAKCFKRNLITEHNIQFLPIKRCEDFYFVSIALVYAKKITVLQERIVYYRINNSTSLEATKDQTPLLFWDALKQLVDYFKENNLYNKYEQSLLNNALDKVVNTYKNSNSIYTLEAIFDMLKQEGCKFFNFEKHTEKYWHNQNNYRFINYLLSLKSIVQYFNDILIENKKLKQEKVSVVVKEKNKKTKASLRVRIKLLKKHGWKYFFIRLFKGKKAGFEYLTKNNLW